MILLSSFVREGKGLKEPIKSMTDCFHFSPDTIAAEAAEVTALGIPAVLLFGLSAKKDATGSQAWSETGVVQRSIKQIKKRTPDLLVITDVCLCAYTDHGHCGVIKNGKIDNDSTCELLAKTALSHAQAGADVIRPFGYDGRPGTLHSPDPRGERLSRCSDLCHTPPNMLPLSTARSATPPNPPQPSATAKLTRWTQPTPTRQWPRLHSI